MKVLVVGGGILGHSIAFQLTNFRDVSVTHLFPSDGRGAATFAAGAMLNSVAEIDSTSLNTPSSQASFKLSMRATESWPSFTTNIFEAGAGAGPSEACDSLEKGENLYDTGTYVLHNTTSSELDYDNFLAIKNTCNNLGIKASFEDPSEIPGYKPEPRSRATDCILLKDEGWINPNTVMEMISKALRMRSNYSLLNARAEKIIIENGLAHSVRTSDHSVLALDQLVLANGSFINELLSTCNRPEEIMSHHIYSGVGASIEVRASISALKNCIRTPNRGGACGLWVLPYVTNTSPLEENRYLIGASNYVSLHPQFHPRAISVAHLLTSATSEINQEFYNAEIIEVKLGNRPITFDQYPVVGQSNIDNIFVANGTRRDGFHLAPVISKFIADYVRTGWADESFHFLSPKRQVIKELSVEDGIEINISHLMSEAFQHGYQPATVRGYEQFEKSMRQEITETHESFCKSAFGIPPLMYKFARDGLINAPT